jgi:hypothetical protein
MFSPLTTGQKKYTLNISSTLEAKVEQRPDFDVETLIVAIILLIVIGVVTVLVWMGERDTKRAKIARQNEIIRVEDARSHSLQNPKRLQYQEIPIHRHR